MNTYSNYISYCAVCVYMKYKSTAILIALEFDSSQNIALAVL